jgi:hypothetical protein
MRTLVLSAVAASVLFAPAAATAADPPAAKTKKSKAGAAMIGHMVYFKLKDSTPEARQKLVDACKKYLASHDGVVFFSAGTIGADFKRDVNDRDWDVALHLVFADKAAHDKYQDHPEHLKFIEENKAGWDKVRVFDSEFTEYTAGKKQAK